MSYIKYPYCNKSDGNDDKILNRRIIYADNKYRL